jgi:DNA polymerase I-like protein with 3'-5' exonuclease and polymerase domains
VPYYARPRDWRDENRYPKGHWNPRTIEKAQKDWTGLPLERAWTYKAFNGLCQGGGAGQTKKALVDIYESLGLPQMTVHDEISKSVVDEREAKQMNEIMVNTIPLLAPVRADMDLGKTWC